MKSKIDDIYKFLESAGDTEVPAKKVMEYLDKIQLRQLGIRHHNRYDELWDGLDSQKDIKSVTEFFGNYLYSVINKENSLIVISLFSSESSEFNTETICGCPKLLNTVQQMVDQGQLSLTLKNKVDDISLMFENRLIDIGSLYYFLHKSLPEETCKVMEEKMNLHGFYGYPISENNKIIATISMAVPDALGEVSFTEIERIIKITRQYLILFYKNQSLDQLNRQYSSVFDAADFAFGLFGGDGHLIKSNISFASLFKPLGEFGLFTPGFIDAIGIIDRESLHQGNEILLDVSEYKSDTLPLLTEYSRGRITPVKPTDSIVSYYMLFLHSRKAELRILETMKVGEQKYQRIFNHIQDVYFEIKLDGTILEISPSIYHYTQINPADLIGTNILAMYSDPRRREDYVNTISTNGRVDNYDLDLTIPDGKFFNTIITASIVDAGTSNERVVGSMVDVTELKKKAKAVIDNEIKFRSLFDNAPIGFVICSIGGDILEINPSFLKIFGLPFIDKSKETNILKNETANRLGISDFVRNVIKTGQPVFSEVQYTYPDGSVHSFKIKISIIPDQTGGFKYILVIAEDITEIKAKESELEASRERFLDIYNNTSDLIYTMDFEGNFTSVNPVAEKWLGYRFPDLKTRNMREFISHDSYKRAEEQIKLKLGNTSEHSTYEVTAFTRNKEKLTLEINSYLRYKDGKPIEVFGIARDITERKKHEEFITLALRERERLIMEVHHRIKNNLQLVLSMLKMYAGTYDNARILQTFRDIIQKIMAIAAAHEDFYFSTDFKDIDFKNYLKTVVINSIEQFDNQNRVRYNIESDDLSASIDEVVPLGLIVSELLSNSIRFGVGKDGMVELKLRFRNHGRKHELTVSDNGPGISAEILKNNGKSLGLSMVAMLAENQLNGKYQIDSNENGTTVKVEF